MLMLGHHYTHDMLDAHASDLISSHAHVWYVLVVLRTELKLDVLNLDEC